MRLVDESRALLLRGTAQQLQESAATPTPAVEEDKDAPESEHQNPAWVRRCVASYLHKGKTGKKKAPAGLERDDVSRAFAICTAQYKKLDNPEIKNAVAGVGKKSKTRASQYQKILAKVRKGPPRKKAG